jgi:hypothetical protein
MSVVYQTPGGCGRRLCTASEFIVHAFMPYGKWTLADGSEVLFNREHEPIWRRADGCVIPADPAEWVMGVADQIWFYREGTTYPAKQKMATEALRAWGLPDTIPISAAAAWREPAN